MWGLSKANPKELLQKREAERWKCNAVANKEKRKTERKDKHAQLEGYGTADQNCTYQKDGYGFWRKCKLNLPTL